MNDRKRVLPQLLLIILGLELALAHAAAPSRSSSTTANSQWRKIDRDLMEITIPKLEELYRTHQYAVTSVVGWYIERIERYNGIYGAVQTLDVGGALAAAGRLDAEAKAAARTLCVDRCGAFRFSPKPIPVGKGWSPRMGGRATHSRGSNCSRRGTQQSLRKCGRQEL